MQFSPLRFSAFGPFYPAAASLNLRALLERAGKRGLHLTGPCRVDAVEAFLSIITNLGDSGFLLPASFALALALWFSGARHTALVFVFAFVACVGATALAKIAFMTCSGQRVADLIYSPSGHASLATMFFLSLALVATKARNQVYRSIFAAGCVLLAAFIAGSRFIIGVHTAAEILAGVAIGLTCFGAFWRFAPPHPAVSARALAIALVPLALAYAIFGAHLGIEHQA